jgi:hypothetical protein
MFLKIIALSVMATVPPCDGIILAVKSLGSTLIASVALHTVEVHFQ